MIVAGQTFVDEDRASRVIPYDVRLDDKDKVTIRNLSAGNCRYL